MTNPSANVKLVSNAMANVSRRKIMTMLVEKERTREEAEQAVGATMLDYHLQMLQHAGLADMKEGLIFLTDFGRNFMETKAEKPAEARKDLSGTKPLQIMEIRQLLPCIADESKFRIIARLEPALGGAMMLLESLFPRARYSERDRSPHHPERQYSHHPLLHRQCHHDDDQERGRSERDLGEPQEYHKKGIASGVTPVPREKVKVDHAEVYKYLPKTDCKICTEQSCYAFAIRLVGREITLDKCTPLLEPKYATNLEHVRALLEYL